MRTPRFWPKIPPNTAPGFYEAVHKYFIVVKGNFYLPHPTAFDHH
jgi:hypothetical protein